MQMKAVSTNRFPLHKICRNILWVWVSSCARWGAMKNHLACNIRWAASFCIVGSLLLAVVGARAQDRINSIGETGFKSEFNVPRSQSSLVPGWNTMPVDLGEVRDQTLINKESFPVEIFDNDCHRAASEFSDDFHQAGKPENLTQILATYRRNESYRMGLDLYRKKCFQFGPAAPGLFKGAEASVGVLVLKNRDREFGICMAFFVAPDVIQTARHCLYSVHGRLLHALSDISFRLNTDLRSPIRVSLIPGDPQVAIGRERLSLATEDILYLKVPLGTSGVPVKTGPPELYVKSAIVGVLTYKPEEKWTDQVAWTGSDQQCFLSATTNVENCYVHVCQVSPGYSGSPIFQIDDKGRVAAVAMHVEATVGSRCRGPTGSAVANIAVSVQQFQ